MKPIRCILGMHRYNPNEVEVYFVGDEGDTLKYRVILRCCYCGKEREDIFTTTNPWSERRTNDDRN